MLYIEHHENNKEQNKKIGRKKKKKSQAAKILRKIRVAIIIKEYFLSRERHRAMNRGPGTE